ncbi:hypothetical protein SALBM311S_04187 [Streptomyces alboniger]
MVDAAGTGGGLEGGGVQAGDADEGAAQGGRVDVGEDTSDGLLAVVLVAVHARVHTQDRAVLRAVDDDQRNAEFHAVAAGADRDQTLGALAGGDGQRTDGVHVVPFRNVNQRRADASSRVSAMISAIRSRRARSLISGGAIWTSGAERL